MKSRLFMLAASVLVAPATPVLAQTDVAAQGAEAGEFRPLFDGRTLTGWRAIPRVAANLYPGGPSLDDVRRARNMPLPVEPELHPARWFVEDGVLIGEQEFPGSGYGGYLLSEETFGDFELVLEVRPDWPVDTGVMVRRRADDWTGFQVLVDHRESGGIGGFFGNGLASFMATPFKIRAQRDSRGNPIGLEEDLPADSLEPLQPEQRERLTYAATAQEFLAAWKWAEWNELRIRVVGESPTITTWVNGVMISQLDTATMQAPNYDAQAVAQYLGRRGHIALEVHDNDAMFGDARWARGGRVRWRNIRIREL